jgi:AcrR family transcriptional regulator
MARAIRDPKSRERIVEAAARAVAEHGVNGASIRVIAAEAGVSTGFVTHYFDDKHAIIEAALEATNARAARRVLRVIGTDEPALTRLRGAAEALMPVDPQRRQEWQLWVAVWGEASKGDSLSVGYRRGWTGLRDMLVALLVEAQEEQQLHADADVEHRADRLVTMLAGLGLLAGVEPPRRVRALATRMLAEELSQLVDVPSLP